MQQLLYASTPSISAAHITDKKTITKHHKVHLNALLGTVHTINRKTRQLQKKNIKDNVGGLACSRKMDSKNLTEQGPRLLQRNYGIRR